MFSIREIVERLGGACAEGPSDAVPGGFSVDSRTTLPGDLFFALPGRRVDGHAYVSDALYRGACGAVVRDPHAIPAGTRDGIVVADPLKALQSLARAWRDQFSIPVVAVTGSNGKTTTKALIAHLAAAEFKVHAARGNYNTEIGLPLAMLALSEGTELGVFELGAEAPGEIRFLASLLRPTAAVITSIGPSHLEGLGTVGAVADEKWELIRSLSDGGWACVNAESPFLRERAARDGEHRILTVGLWHGDVRCRVVSSTPRWVLEVESPSMRLESPLLGEHNAMNLLLAAVCTERLGVPSGRIEARIRSFTPLAHRLQPLAFRHGVLIDDTYNANPASMAAALEVLRSLGGPETSRVFVFGDMLGLGPRSSSFHSEVVARAHDAGVAKVIPVGERAVAACRRVGGVVVEPLMDRKALGGRLAALLGPVGATGDVVDPKVVVLIKGSRGIALDELVADVVERASQST